MMIGIVSDTHDHLEATTKALEAFEAARVEAVIHAGDFVAPFTLKLMLERLGDVPLIGVFGNNDGERRGLAHLLPDLVAGARHVELGGRKICVVHDLAALPHEIEIASDIIVSGHTHTKPVAESREGRLYVNPGECCGWLTGFCRVSLLDTAALTVQNLTVMKLERPRR